MRAFSIETLNFEQLASHVSSDELTVIITPTGDLSTAAKSLSKKSCAALQRKSHYIDISAGFFGTAERPWVMPIFTKNGANALERRWAFHDWAKSLQSMFSCKKICIYLDQGCSTEHIVRAEDLVTCFSGPLYTTSRWDSVRVIAANTQSLTKQDAHYNLRFEHQLEFRRWVNENPDSLTSIEIGDRLKSFASQNDCTFTSLEESALRDENMNLLLAVGQGAKKSPSRLHILTKNLKPGVAPLALVGKGITFDTGGINLKPHESFVNCMKNDMGGAGLMAQLFMGLVRSGYSKPIILAIPACENAIDAMSMKPGVIIKARNGKSVIIEHTDAEGRLILADTMSYVCDNFNPRHMYTAATLTTASLRQFTNFFTPVHFAGSNFKKNLTESSAHYGEAFTFWDEFLPFLSGNKSNAADLTNMGRMPSHASMGGGSNVAAHFLKEFAKTPYTHLDIFNTIWNWSGDYPGAHYGCTGSVFNSLWATLRNEAI
jgi:leucyl aminopeptidase